MPRGACPARRVEGRPGPLTGRAWPVDSGGGGAASGAVQAVRPAGGDAGVPGLRGGSRRRAAAAAGRRRSRRGPVRRIAGAPPGGQVGEPGRVDGVASGDHPGGAPGRQPQPGSPGAPDPGLAGVGAGGTFAGSQAGVFDQRARCGEPGRVTGLGQDRRRPYRGQALIEQARSVRSSSSSTATIRVSVSTSRLVVCCQSPRTRCTRSQDTGPDRAHAGRVAQRREHRPHDPQTRPGRPQPGRCLRTAASNRAGPRRRTLVRSPPARGLGRAQRRARRTRSRT